MIAVGRILRTADFARATDEEKLLVGKQAQTRIANVQLATVELDIFSKGEKRGVQA